MELVLILAVAVVVASWIGAKVANGTWADTWAGTGQEESGRKYPGGPVAHSDSPSPPWPGAW